MHRMCPYHKINVNNPVMKPNFISSISWPSALFCLEIPFIQFNVFPSFACSISPNNAFKVSCCLFIPFPKNGSVRRWVACVVDTLNLLYRRTIQMVQTMRGPAATRASDGKRNRFSRDCLTSTMLTWTDSDCYSCNEFYIATSFCRQLLMLQIRL